jgi:hypothetical protein
MIIPKVGLYIQTNKCGKSRGRSPFIGEKQDDFCYLHMRDSYPICSSTEDAPHALLYIQIEESNVTGLIVEKSASKGSWTDTVCCREHDIEIGRFRCYWMERHR